MRLFVSIDLPDPLADAVAAVQSNVESAEGLSLTDPHQAHFTLKFLGDVPETELSAVTEMIETAVESTAVDPFPLTVAGVGVFPSLDYIRVVWLGASEGTQQATCLHDAVESEAVERGFDPADHEFTPHVTIGRMNHAGGKEIIQQYVQNANPKVGRFEVSEIRLKESILRSDGPEYSTVERFSL